MTIPHTASAELSFVLRQKRYLTTLRRTLWREHSLDGLLVPARGAFGPDDLSPTLRHVTGFTGESGTLVILPERAALFTDGRFTVQAHQEVASGLYLIFDEDQNPLEQWLSHEIREGMTLGFDPEVYTDREVEDLRKALRAREADLRPLTINTLETLFANDRPQPPTTPLVAIEYADSGDRTDAKILRMGKKVAAAHCHVAILTNPASIAWLLNIRANDIPFTPVALCRAILHASGAVDLFIDAARVSPDIRSSFGSNIKILPPDNLRAHLQTLGQYKSSVLIDRSSASYAMVDVLRSAGAELVEGADPCLLAKAIKNDREILSFRRSHIDDGAAFTDFLAWLDRTRRQHLAITELEASAQMEIFCRAKPAYRGPSFETIAATGPHAAIVHYVPKPGIDTTLANGQFFLMDRGGHYEATTDVTRTVALGQITQNMRDDFTRVLQGHIAVASARFTPTTMGSEIDLLGRRALQAVGKNYDHATGHGVGTYLSVHEAPPRISSKRSTTLAPGMVVSNEPGYYDVKQGYGIRTECLLLVIAHPDDTLGFEVLTLVPIDRKAINLSMLSIDERAWVDAYHAKVRATLMPEVRPETRDWLRAETEPLPVAPSTRHHHPQRLDPPAVPTTTCAGAAIQRGPTPR